MWHNSSTSAIGPTICIKGQISCREALLVEGEIEGVLESQSLISIGPNAKVNANITAHDVTIYGSVTGNVEAVSKILVTGKGSLIGDIRAASIAIEDGGYFEGSVDIVRPEPSQSTAEPVPIRLQPAAS